MRRLVSAVGLFLLAPAVAEFLLGNFPVTHVVRLFQAALLYGGGALLVREVARRCGWGWPTMLCWAAAYGVVQEALLLQDLFNPDWMGWHLIDYGYVPALGIALPWTLFILALHTVWSISVPIVLVERLSRSRRTTPWLGRVALAVLAAAWSVLMVGGAFATPSRQGFTPSVPQVVGSVVGIVALAGLGVLLGLSGNRRTRSRPAPSVWVVGVVALVAGSVFLLVYAADPYGLSPWFRGLGVPPWMTIVTYVTLFAVVIAVVTSWSRRAGWSDDHRLALAGGALLTYLWHAFPWEPLERTSGTVDLVSNTVLALGAVALLVVAARRRRQDGQPGG